MDQGFIVPIDRSARTDSILLAQHRAKTNVLFATASILTTSEAQTFLEIAVTLSFKFLNLLPVQLKKDLIKSIALKLKIHLDKRIAVRHDAETKTLTFTEEQLVVQVFAHLLLGMDESELVHWMASILEAGESK